MDRSELFIGTLDEIEQRLNTNKPYDILMTAGKLRLIMLDDPTLISIVKKYRIRRIWFDVANYIIPRDALAWFLADGLHPEPGESRLQVSLDELLKKEIMYADGNRFTVKDIVRFTSHILGGVHAGSAKEVSDIALAELEKQFSIGGGSATIYSLRAICRVVLDGLSPLREIIKAELLASG